MERLAEVPWVDWARTFAMLAPIVIGMIWWDWRQRCKSRALWKQIEEERAAFDDWIRDTAQCPACGGCGRVKRYTIRAVNGHGA